MRHSTSRALFQYWNTLRSNRPAPLRPEFEPAAIGNILSSVFMLELLNDIAAIRLAGGDICAMFGEDLRGAAFAKLWMNGVDRKPSTIASRCVHDVTPYVLRADGLTHNGSVSELELLMVPLIGSDGQTNRVVGTLADLDQNNAIINKHLIGMSLTSIKPIDRDTIPVDFATSPRAKTSKKTKPDSNSQGSRKNSGNFYVIDGGISS